MSGPREVIVRKEQTYDLKVSLLDIRPPIWRRIRVHADVTLERLHEILQVAMGWRRRHLHQFELEGRVYAERHDGMPAAYGDVARTRLDALLVRVRDRLHYEYDLGDGWVHSIVLEKVHARQPEDRVCMILDGARACPPEDCGGAGGYEHLLEVIADETDPEHAEMLAWVGKTFDPEKFDVEAVNRMLRRKFPTGRFQPTLVRNDTPGMRKRP